MRRGFLGIVQFRVLRKAARAFFSPPASVFFQTSLDAFDIGSGERSFDEGEVEQMLQVLLREGIGFALHVLYVLPSHDGDLHERAVGVVVVGELLGEAVFVEQAKGADEVLLFA